jgi:hypothetical protein
VDSKETRGRTRRPLSRSCCETFLRVRLPAFDRALERAPG